MSDNASPSPAGVTNAQSAFAPPSGESTTPTPQGTPVATPPPPAPTPAAPSLEELTKTITSAVTSALPQPAAPAPPPLSQEELDRALKVFKPSMKHIEAIQGGGEGAVQALAEIAQGIYQQANTMAAYQLAMMQEQLEARLNPLQSHYQQQQARELQNEFMTAYPTLKGYEPLLMSIRDQLVREGTKFKDKTAAFAEVAKRADAVIKSLPGAGSAASNGTPANQQPATAHQMSTLTGGGQSGTGTSGKNDGAAKPLRLSVFD